MLCWVKRRLYSDGFPAGMQDPAAKPVGWTGWQLADRRDDRWFFMGWDVSEDCREDDEVAPAKLIDPDGKLYE